MDVKKIEHGVSLVLEGIGEDLRRPGIRATPRRVASMLAEILGGSELEAARSLRVIEDEKHDEMVLIKNIPSTRCASIISSPSREWPTWPIFRKPGASSPEQDRPGGGGPVPAAPGPGEVDEADRRPARRAPEALGVMVVIEAEHMCMSMRGAKKPRSITVTSAVRGSFRKNRRPGPRP